MLTNTQQYWVRGQRRNGLLDDYDYDYDYEGEE